MTQIITKGIMATFGVNTEWFDMPITNAPDGAKIRRRFRNNSYGRAYIKTNEGISEWILAKDGENALKLVLQQGMNKNDNH